MNDSIEERLFIQKYEVVSKYMKEFNFNMGESEVYQSKLNEITHLITSNKININDLTQEIIQLIKAQNKEINAVDIKGVRTVAKKIFYECNAVGGISSSVVMIKLEENEIIISYKFGPDEFKTGLIELNKITEFIKIEDVLEDPHSKRYAEHAGRRLAKLWKEKSDFPEKIIITPGW
ncbi:hypothetical protein GCM10010969_03200 [Saccharibacillus kuerlensis]|uniref:Uncharacterized protein n=2 Tax=Saccharibacillus kuerlensis TaxID=459527 RepID=A0ABQ2KSM6_9BACL|nr:hypothetical protein GCM10010969_03200 [Saccharibacillus kuerlensis]